ncbi:hypothetical protein [Saccharothrix australiensis]|uniref:Uncharacterized protein n=1 Tax=Saccharothrix australiensis TaxID=2072 RepID=A0A495W3K8_9PSEU|nr:hypothetical protein [Saccharothrix australiensis]RKT54398.1 hypothetical protein C8E97_3018 [Saccharothrix australiensis]
MHFVPRQDARADALRTTRATAAQPAHGLFSHPESHETHTGPARPADEQRTYTDLFREPAWHHGVRPTDTSARP